MLDLANGETAGAVKQNLVRNEADPTANRALPVDLGIAGSADRRIGPAALDVGAVDVAFEAENEIADLVIAAAVKTGGHAVHVVLLLKIRERAIGCHVFEQMIVAKRISDLAADIKTGPRKNR